MAIFQKLDTKKYTNEVAKLYQESLILTLMDKNSFLKLKFGAKKATGELVRSIRYKLLSDGKNGWKIKFTSADYLNTIDQGQPVGTKVPVGKLTTWAKAKGLSWGGKSYKGIARMVSRSIEKKGVKAIPIYEATSRLFNSKLKNINILQVQPNLRNQILEDIKKQLK